MNPVLQAKLKHGNIYIIEFDKYTAGSFSLLSWREYKALRDYLTAYPSHEENVKDYIFEKTIIEFFTPGILYKGNNLTEDDISAGYMYYEDLIEYIPAGVVDSLVNAVLLLSGASNIYKFIEDINIARDTDIFAYESLITAIMKSQLKLTEKELEDMTWPQVAQLFAAGESMLSGQIPDFPLSIKKEKQEQKEQKYQGFIETGEEIN